MTDVHTVVVRSKNMRAIKATNTKPELFVRKYLHAAGFRFRVHRKELPGKPDIVLPKYRAIVFVHGCFWHCHPGCKFAVIPMTRRAFWQEKLEKNFNRDKRQIAELEAMGWRVFVIWECEVKKPIILDVILDSIRAGYNQTK